MIEGIVVGVVAIAQGTDEPVDLVARSRLGAATRRIRTRPEPRQVSRGNCRW